MFKSFAKFFTGRSSSQESNTNDQSTKLCTHEETPDTTNAPFFSSTDVAISFARRLDKISHQCYYEYYSDRIKSLVNNLEAQRRPANAFVYVINEADIPPKSVLAQLILDGFHLEYCDKKVYITLPTSDIESEADKHLENFMAQMEETKRMEKDEQEAAAAAEAAANAHREDNTDSAQPADENTASGNPIPAEMQKMMNIQDVIGA